MNAEAPPPYLIEYMAALDRTAQLGLPTPPRVLVANEGIDPDRYSGFAFGMGVDRVAMNRYDIGNIRLLFDNDERLLRQVRG